MRWNAPLSAEHAGLLLDRMSLGPGQAIADLGCGWGELLMTAVTRAGPGATGTECGQFSRTSIPPQGERVGGPVSCDS
jgi:hypothetical protein